MKKFVILLFVAMAALSAKAQVYVGGTVALWHNDDLDATTFALNPEVECLRPCTIRTLLLL